MSDLRFLFANFFTHKDFLPPAKEIAGTIFTPLHIIYASVLLATVIVLGLWVAKKSERVIRWVLGVIWAVMVCFEVVIVTWESVAGATVALELTGNLSLYPCSIFLYAMPFAVFGKGWMRYMGCGYVCSLGLLGGAINFVYPANVLSRYSCLSFAGTHTFMFHASIIFCALLMLRSGYHSYTRATRLWHLLIPALPALAVSVAANIVNFTITGADYMFFKLESFFFAPIGAATPDWLSVIIVYLLYLLIHALPYLPAYLSKVRTEKQAAKG
ncbi:MAG: YwaF family protein [Clostridia bacterium]|nr:YwaF family protein [Clostridia bacterium]